MRRIADHPDMVAVYRCQKGGIHLVYQNLNIGMTPLEFHRLNQCAQDAQGRIERGEWGPACVLFSYRTTSLVLTTEQFAPLAQTMGQAGETVEALLELENWKTLTSARDREEGCLAVAASRVEPVSLPSFPINSN